MSTTAHLLLNDSAAERTPPGVLTLSDLDSAVWTWAMSSLVLSAFLGEERWGGHFPSVPHLPLPSKPCLRVDGKCMF